MPPAGGEERTCEGRGPGPSLALAILKVGLLYFAILLAGAAIFKLMPEGWLAPFDRALAWAVQATLGAVGVKAERVGATLLVPLPDGKPLVVYIVRHCLGIHSTLGYLALVFALPAVPLKKRLWWALGGTALLGAANVARTATTIWAGAKFGLKAFDILHLTVWRVGLSALALLLALLFAFSVGRRRESLFLPHPSQHPGKVSRTRQEGGSSP